MRRRLIALAALSAAVVAAGVLPAIADTAQPAVVSADPEDWTPHVLDGTVRAIAVVDRTVVVGGDFQSVSDAPGRWRYQRHYLFSFGLDDGRVRAFAPDLDGPVYALAPGADGTVYVGGAFKTVNGAAQRGIARLRVVDGGRAAGFGARINWGDVRTLAARGGRVYAGGTFSTANGTNRAGLVRLDASTGAVHGGFDAKLAAQGMTRVKVEDVSLSPDGTRLVVIGGLTHASGQARAQIALLDAATGAPTSWWTDAYQPRCSPEDFESYVRGVDFAPDGGSFVVVTTGHDSAPNRTCDTAARFEVAGAGRHNPTWVNHTGGNTLFTVAVTDSAVYVGGHQQWLDNPHGRKFAGPGAVSRPGIGAIDPRTGKALSWNPTRSRGVGVRALVATDDGLFVGSDTDQLGREYHGRIGLFPPG